MASPTTALVSSLSSAFPSPTTTFIPLVGLAFEEYCLNPPPDSCLYGPCPNPDVTGIGQQVSIYITSVTFLIVLVYFQDLVLPLLYTHLGLIYSLLIASSASIGRRELTKNDGFFVLITVASPASFYLWFLSVRSLWPSRAKSFPVQTSNPKSLEVLFLKALSLGSLLFEIIMISLIFGLPNQHFSQPACNQSYGNKLWIELIWGFPYTIQVGWLWLTISFSRKVREVNFPTSTTSDRGQWQDIAQADVVTWTEISVKSSNGYPPAPKSSYYLPTILAIIQLCAIPNVGFIINQNFLVVILFIPATFSEARLFSKKDGLLGFIWLMLPFLAWFSYAMSSLLLDSYFPTSSDLILAFVSWFILKERFCIPDAVNSSGVWIIRISSFVLFATALFGSTFTWIMSPAKLESTEGSFLTLKPQPLSLNIMTLPLWISAWLVTSIWPAGKRLSYRQMWESTMSRAHILKAGLLIITPNALWIQSSASSNPLRSTNMTFGQISALVVSLVSVISLFHAARRIDKKFCKLKAFFLSQPFSTSQDNVLPVDSYVRASMSQQSQREGASAESGGPPSNAQGEGEINNAFVLPTASSASTSQSPPQPPPQPPAPTSVSAPAPLPTPPPAPAAGSASPPTPGPSVSASQKRVSFASDDGTGEGADEGVGGTSGVDGLEQAQPATLLQMRKPGL